jgi:hypothetical protein
MRGGVTVWGPLANFAGDGWITFPHFPSNGGTVREFRPGVVVGAVSGTGTAIVIDIDENVYLYTPPNIVDPPLPSVEMGLSLIAEKGDSLCIGKDISVKQYFPDGTFELVISDSDKEI